MLSIQPDKYVFPEEAMDVNRVITLDGLKYLVGSIPVAKVQAAVTPHSKMLVPVTILNFQNVTISGVEFEIHAAKQLDALEKVDDVMSSAFKEVIFFYSYSDTHFDLIVNPYSMKLNYHQTGKGKLTTGPYFLVGTELFLAYRLYDDQYLAFMCGMTQIPCDPPCFQIGPLGLVPVPSRHYSPPPSKCFPLSGLRVAVKDIYDIKGITTTAGSTAYAAMHKPASSTAECIKKLIHLGVVIVGKTKTVQFASGMFPGDWEDFVCPINPRGDLALDPQCSSAGSAAAVAGYEWLDFAIDSDTLGSMTGPSAACGVFGIRPSLGRLSNVGDTLIRPDTYLDTPGYFTRSLPMLENIATYWSMNNSLLSLSSMNSVDQNPSVRLLVPFDRFTSYKKDIYLEIYRLADKFVCDSVPDSTTVEHYWRTSRYSPTPAKTLHQCLATTVATIQLYDCYHNNSQFLQNYKVKYGHQPKVDSLIKYKWELGQKITRARYATALEERAAFRKFLHNDLLTPGTIMLLPNGDDDAKYRFEVSIGDEAASAWQGFGFQNTAFSVLGGVPAISVPIKEQSYLSKYTKKLAPQPTSMMVIGPRNSDVWLLNMIETVFRASGRPLDVRTGPSMYNLERGHRSMT